MANIKVLDANRLAKYIASTGAGTDADPILLRRAVDGMGEVQANPTANTLLARIKALETALAALEVIVDGRLPALVGGKIPVDASFSSSSVAIDQTTPGTTNLVNVNGGASQTADIKVTLDSESVAVAGPLTDTELRASDIKVTLDSESVAVTGPLTDAQLTTQALAKEATLGSIKTAAESLAVATPDTAAGDLASMSADLGTIRADIATVKADIATVASNSEITPATVTGTCTAAYVTALSLACAGVRNKTLVIVNTDAALTMKYRIRGFAKSGSSYYNEIQAEATLAASTSQPHVIENSYDVITVEVIDGSGHATYAIDYCGGQ